MAKRSASKLNNTENQPINQESPKPVQIPSIETSTARKILGEKSDNNKTKLDKNDTKMLDKCEQVAECLEVMDVDQNTEKETIVKKKTVKIFDFFDRSLTKSEEKAGPVQNTESKTQSEKTVEKKKVEKKPAPASISDHIIKLGKMPLDGDYEPLNARFGDLVCVIELYNLVMPLFQTFLQQTQFRYKRLKYEQLLAALTGKSDVDRVFYVNLIKRFLAIFIYHHKVMPVI